MKLFDKKFVYLEWDDVLKGKKVFVGDTLPQLKEKLHSELFVSVVENKGEYPFTSSEDDMNFAMVYYDPNYECKSAYAQGKMIQTRNSNAHWDWADCQSEPQWKDGFEYRVKPEMWTASVEDNDTVHIMPVCEWSKSYGRKLIEGLKEECKAYVMDNYHGAMCIEHVEQKTSELHDCSVFMCQGFEEGKKRRMTNRELAKWIMQGNGQMKQRDGNYIYHIYNVYDIHNDDTPCPNYLVIRGWDEEEWHEPEVEE